MMLTKKQKTMIKEFEDHLLFGFMGTEEIKSAKDFIAKWDYNIRWIKDHIEEAEGIIHDYRKRYHQW